jgi:beta-glucanase (GH16 family)
MLSIALSIATAFTMAPAGSAADAPSNPPASPQTSTLAFADEFDGPAGTPPDSAKWTHEVNGGGGGNNELQFYTDSTDNAALDGEGHLVITARKENPANYQCWYGTCEYTSARLNTATTFTQAYGHIEARIKVPRGQGMWPAFWMLGDRTPDQISWSVDGTVYQTHTPADTNGNPWAFDHPFFVILNIAVGGNWPGSPDDTTQFPQQMVVDYVRVTTSG